MVMIIISLQLEDPAWEISQLSTKEHSPRDNGYFTNWATIFHLLPNLFITWIPYLDTHWWSCTMNYKNSILLDFTLKIIKCTLLFVFVSGILVSIVLGGIGIWVGFDLIRLNGDGWSLKTVDRQSFTVSFIAFSCDSYEKREITIVTRDSSYHLFD